MDAILYDELLTYGLPRGYLQAEPSMLLEDNGMIIRPSASMGGKPYKRWRIYEMPVV